MRATLSGLLAGGRVLLADGGTGTACQALGLPLGALPDRWVLEHPDRVRAVHRAFVDAGADIVLTDTFGGTAARLAPHGLAGRAYELARAAAVLAAEVVDRAAQPVVVAGSVGPTGVADVRTADFAPTVRGLRDGGADVVWIETMGRVDEIRAAVGAATEAGLPAVVTCSFHAAGRTSGGLGPEDLAALARTLDPPPLAIGANCGDGPDATVDAVRRLVAADPAAVVVAKGNLGLPRVADGVAVYEATPAAMAEHARIAVAAGARIVGGCCGTTAEHVAAMRAALDGGRRA